MVESSNITKLVIGVVILLVFALIIRVIYHLVTRGGGGGIEVYKPDPADHMNGFLMTGNYYQKTGPKALRVTDNKGKTQDLTIKSSKTLSNGNVEIEFGQFPGVFYIVHPSTGMVMMTADNKNFMDVGGKATPLQASVYLNNDPANYLAGYLWNDGIMIKTGANTLKYIKKSGVVSTITISSVTLDSNQSPTIVATDSNIGPITFDFEGAFGALRGSTAPSQNGTFQPLGVVHWLYNNVPAGLLDGARFNEYQLHATGTNTLNMKAGSVTNTANISDKKWDSITGFITMKIHYSIGHGTNVVLTATINSATGGVNIIH